MSNEQKTDLQLANEALVELKASVSTTDRREAPCSEAIIVQYLNGKGRDLDTAMMLLRFFRERIALRRKEIAQN